MVRDITKEDHAMLCDWWRAWDWPIIPIEALPRNGVIADEMAAGFLYNSDSKLCWIGWLVTDKRKDLIDRSNAVNKVFVALEQKAKEMGKKGIFTFTGKPSLIRRHEAHGYRIGDTEVTQLMKWIE